MKIGYDFTRTNFFLLFLILVTYPFSVKICNFLVLMLLANWLLGLKKGVINWNKKAIILLLTIPFPLTLFSLLYSHNLAEGIKVLEKQIPFFVFPLVLGTIPTFTEATREHFFDIVIAVAFISLLVFIGFAGSDYMKTGDVGVFYWKSLTDRFTFHPSYFSLFISFSAFYIFLGRGSHIFTARKIILLIWAAFMLLLLSSKIHIVLFIVILCGIIMISVLHMGWGKSIATVLIILVIVALAVWKSPNMQERFSHLDRFTYKLDDPPNTFNELTIRFALTECSWKIIKKNWLLGVGAGDVEQSLMEVYHQYGYQFGFLNQQNPHNQYLSTWLSTGIIGLLAFLSMLGYSFYKAMRDRNYAHFIFLFLFIVSFFFESMLERQKGIVLFTLINSIFIFHCPSNSKKVGSEGTDS